MSLLRLHQIALYLIAAAWLATLCYGMGALQRYANTPGTNHAPAEHWPADSRIKRNVDSPTLLIFAHPQCPCTRATISELELIVARCPDQLAAYVVFIKPAGVNAQWLETDLWRSASKIPDVTVLEDSDCREALRFHAATSGQTMLYTADGRLAFAGGITAARGHGGDNHGRAAIIDIVTATAASAGKPLDRFPVFGCPLHDADDGECVEAKE